MMSRPIECKKTRVLRGVGTSIAKAMALMDLPHVVGRDAGAQVALGLALAGADDLADAPVLGRSARPTCTVRETSKA
jgi:hypothetical protein